MILYNVDEDGLLQETTVNEKEMPDLVFSRGYHIYRHIRYYISKEDALEEFLNEKRLDIIRAKANIARATEYLYDVTTAHSTVKFNLGMLRAGISKQKTSVPVYKQEFSQ
jgi:hypothetical protein